VTGIRGVAIKVALFALASILLLVLLVNTMLDGVSGDVRDYTAEFDDVNGLRVGDDVKAAGVRVGQVTAIDVTDTGAEVQLEVVEEQAVLTNSTLTMRYQNLLGQRYVALDLPQGEKPGKELGDDGTIRLENTSHGFDLTELLNGFRPLFEILQPEDVNTLATSMIKVLQGEGGTIESLLRQTSELTSFIADRDEVIGEVMTNLEPVLDNLTEQDDEISATVVELKRLMTGLARDRKAIGASIDGISQLVGSTSSLLREARVPLTNTSRQLEELGRATSYENALNTYVCSAVILLGPLEVPLGSGGDGPWSEVCS
jgi:phospholipid/cholesterol/gamma-HCH transport system substrate-binding protein